MEQIQVTLFSTTGKYRPMSTIVEVESMGYYLTHTREVEKKAIQKMCRQRYIDGLWLKKNGYTQIKIRRYDREKIAREKAERYEQIKRERGWIKEDNTTK